ncbi:MAG: hypothetical protein AABZ15_03855 [Nitrospirota bacterium]
MSYVVTIKRTAGPPISYQEFVEIALKDPAFSPDPVSAQLPEPSFQWIAPKSKKKSIFHYWSPEIAVETPSGEALRKLQDIAKQLNSELYGEEGENLTSVEAYELDMGNRGVLSSSCIAAVIIGGLLALYWIFVE